MGGGSVSVNSNFKYIVCNDIITDLISFYNELYTKNINDVLNVLNELKLDKEDQNAYNNFRDDYNANPDPYKFFALCSSCTNNMMRFNKQFKFNQTFGKEQLMIQPYKS